MTIEVFYRGRTLESLVGVHLLDQVEVTLEKSFSEKDRHLEVHTLLTRPA